MPINLYHLKRDKHLIIHSSSILFSENIYLEWTKVIFLKLWLIACLQYTCMKDDYLEKNV